MVTKKSTAIPCIITTDKRGVFMGYINPAQRLDTTITAKDVRMVVYWSQDVRGLFGLAANGPSKGCKVTAAAPGCVLHGVTAVLDISAKAEKAFAGEPWA